MHKFICIAFVLKISVTLCQEDVTPPVLKNAQLKEFEAHAIGDSVLICYRMGLLDRTGKPVMNSVLLKPDNAVEEINLPSFLFDKIIKVVDVDSALNVYYLTQERQPGMVRKVIYRKATKSAKVSREFYALYGNVIGAFNADDFIFLSKNSSEDSLIVSKIQNLKITDRKSFFIPEQILKGSAVPAFIKAGDKVIPAQADAVLKFFLDGKNLTICYDRPRKPKNQFQGFTEIINIDLASGQMRRNSVGESTLQTFRTFYSNGYLFKVTKGKEFNLSVFKDEKLVHSTVFRNGPPLTNQSAYKRNGADNTVTKAEVASQAVSGNANPFVIAQATEEGQFLLTVGSHSATTPPAYIKHSGGLAGVLVSALDASVSSSMHQCDDVDKYFYLRGNPTNGFTYDDGNGSADQLIESYEVALTANKLKQYLGTRNKIYAFYRKEGTGTVEIIRFGNR